MLGLIQISKVSIIINKSRKKYFDKLNIGAPTFAKNYYPGTKIHIFDSVNRTELPMIEIAFNETISKSFLLSNYPGH